MSLRRQFITALVTFVVALTAAGGFVAWRAAQQALEAELDRRAAWVAGAAVATGLPASTLRAIQPGFGVGLWEPMHNRLRELIELDIAREAYILQRDNTAIVTSYPYDAIPPGDPLPQFDLYTDEIEEARELGFASTVSFRNLIDGQRYKWGFADIEGSGMVLAVLMPADYLVPLDTLQRSLLFGSILAAVLAGLLAVLLAAAVNRPMDRLSQVALRIQRGDMREPVAIERPKELGRLAQAMERMREGILRRDEQLRLMVAQVAHEIRNPLGGLELFASAAEDAEDPAERGRLLERIRSEVKALNTIIDDFLTFARPTSPWLQTTDLREPVREAADLVRAELEEQGGHLDVSLSEQPLLAHVDPDHAKRATLNLLKNAAQASGEVRLWADLENGEVVISVSDAGPGVPEELRGRLFDPFVTDKAQGAGLGLAIVKKVAEDHGGRVELADPSETNGGRGAEFRLYFGSPGGAPSSVTPAD